MNLSSRAGIVLAYYILVALPAASSTSAGDRPGRSLKPFFSVHSSCRCSMCLELLV
jgi:hypothetical protein